MLNTHIDSLRSMIQASKRVVVFTGAGISTESGIPDFRSPGTGTWEKMKPIYFDEFLRSPAARREAWRRRFESDATMRAAEPNRGHRAVARLVREGKVRAVITQNIDGLHQASGIPDDQVIELHGNTTYATCLSCGMRHEIADIHAGFSQTDAVPDCRACGGLLKTATVSFGQSMPELPMLRAREEVAAADLCLVLGSSLVVYPAAGFPEMAKRMGARLAIVNRQETPLDDIADLVVHEGIGDVLGGAVGVN
ncbi:SIR2 family NAD-dependent protein deacylase [Paracraurococcus lichenis]|uniref:protein acetyllysine N-acetyltransferase n=1 Tax=Paracraurococcus lichenis TaxID=3064888 RepID=A0ABT9E232_9PROT|nr:Sir2 family NAD-dependent protein deacetylase [Paracraurococcus sp. LOR1-02]MDO9710226.1 Sir2 family NAD-dependent protein deacetylase [Paracraurococcus sp. LOR1-02]